MASPPNLPPTDPDAFRQWAMRRIGMLEERIYNDDEDAAGTAGIIGGLAKENERLRASLAWALPFAESHWDAGPYGEGWQSKELLDKCDEVRAILEQSGKKDE